MSGYTSRRIDTDSLPSHNDREQDDMKLISCISVAVLIGAGLSAAQTNTSPLPEDKQIARYSSRHPSDLATRSEMQQPRPIPIVNPLRFPEIPVAACSDNARFPFSSEASQQPAGISSEANVTPQPAACADPPMQTQLVPK